MDTQRLALGRTNMQCLILLSVSLGKQGVSHINSLDFFIRGGKRFQTVMDDLVLAHVQQPRFLTAAMLQKISSPAKWSI